MPDKSEDRRYVEDELREEGPMEAVKDDAKKAKDAVTPDSSSDSEPRQEGRTSRPTSDEDRQHLEDELREEGPMEAVKDDAKKAKDAVTRDR